MPQGKTCEKILVEVDTQSLTSAKDSYYVAISRAREQAVIYTNNQEKLPAAMSRMNVKEAALELRTQRVIFKPEPARDLKKEMELQR